MGLLSWMENNPAALQGIGTMLGGAGSLYGGIMQANAANGLINLQKNAFNLNRSLLLKQDAERDAISEMFKQRSSGLVDLGSV